MEARTVNNLPPAGTDDDAVRCLIAIELSKKSWIVAVNTPLSHKISRHTLKACDGKELLDVEKLLRSLMAYLRGEPKVWSVVRVPSVAEEDDRRLHRERGRL